MAVNEQHRHVEIAVELDEAARLIEHLQQVVRQFSAWHRRVVKRRKYLGEDETGNGVTGPLEAAEQLEAPAVHSTGRARLGRPPPRYEGVPCFGDVAVSNRKLRVPGPREPGLD